MVSSTLTTTSVTAVGTDRKALTAVVSARAWMMALMGISSSSVKPMPIRPAHSPMMNVSALNTCETLCRDAPMARRIPISLVRSSTEI